MQARAGEGEQGGSCGSLKACLALHIHSSYLELFILERLLSDVFDGAWSRQVGSKGLWCLFNLTSSTERRIWELCLHHRRVLVTLLTAHVPRMP